MAQIYKYTSIFRVLILTALLISSAATAADDWSFQLEPYLLGASIEGDTSIGRATGVEVDVDFGDIMDSLDLAGMIHFEAHNANGWGTILDYGFMKLSSDKSGPLGGVLAADVRQGILEALLARRIELGGGHIDYLAGFRWWDNDVDIDIDAAIFPGSTTASVEEDWIDLVVGARWTKPLNDKWELQLRGDIGGFGLESDFTAVLATGIQYQLGETIDLDIQYKALWVDYESGSRGQPGYFEYDTVTHGPIIGLIFSF